MSALPALVHSWQTDHNHEVTQQTTGTLQAKELFYQISVVLTGFATNPVTVAGSSNSTVVGMDAVNRFASAANIVAGTGAHSWIVFRWTSGLQVCFDFNHASAWLVTCVMSASAGFTGGTTSARPTATDEVVNATSLHYSWGDITGAMNIHAVHSNDGNNTYLAVTAQNVVRTLILIGKAYGAPSDWTSPHFVTMRGSGDTTLTAISTYAGATDRVSARHPSGSMPLRMAVECVYNGITSGFQTMAFAMSYNVSSWTGELPMSEVGLVSMAAPVAYRGVIPDLWRTGDGIPPGTETRSALTSTHSFTSFCGFLFPWPADPTIHASVL